ncbi:uncharacterized protein LOC115611913 isoform X1 [Strigops habroptila]|uniref:uncharacterized protein LOC115611913 isoform X1 n=1 Tax=Strigops habroptila TaxID=2489341 RepID=UPI0011CFBD39|nr:uncharacterized protein LOC115611913 isoform X1 [Strigops habroptila]XP_030351440.1 uncharacterized protein LOC115611913 isoform X1 [Strigops habroptila]
MPCSQCSSEENGDQATSMRRVTGWDRIQEAPHSLMSSIFQQCEKGTSAGTCCTRRASAHPAATTPERAKDMMSTGGDRSLLQRKAPRAGCDHGLLPVLLPVFGRTAPSLLPSWARSLAPGPNQAEQRFSEYFKPTTNAVSSAGTRGSGWRVLPGSRAGASRECRRRTAASNAGCAQKLQTSICYKHCQPVENLHSEEVVTLLQTRATTGTLPLPVKQTEFLPVQPLHVGQHAGHHAGRACAPRAGRTEVRAHSKRGEVTPDIHELPQGGERQQQPPKLGHGAPSACASHHLQTAWTQQRVPNCHLSLRTRNGS